MTENDGRDDGRVEGPNPNDGPVAAELVTVLYEELHAAAQHLLGKHAHQHTLQPTALVHEVYLKLARKPETWESRRHFLCVAAKAMRQVLSDYAAAKRAQKRGGSRRPVTLDDDLLVAPARGDAVDLLALDEALVDLEEAEPRSAQIVQLRFLVGMPIDEVAEVLDLSPTTVKEKWRAARAWLRRRLAPPE